VKQTMTDNPDLCDEVESKIRAALAAKQAEATA
jgi:hypothetical protein